MLGIIGGALKTIGGGIASGAKWFGRGVETGATEAAKGIATGATEAAKGVATGAKFVGHGIQDVGGSIGMGKDGIITNFVRDYVPGGGLGTSAFQAFAGHLDYARYDAVKGLSTGANFAITSVGVLGGPGGVMLAGGLGGLGGLAGNAIEGSMRGLTKDSIIKNRVEGLSWQGLGTSFVTGAAVAGVANSAGKYFSGTRLGQALSSAANRFSAWKSNVKLKMGLAPSVPGIPTVLGKWGTYKAALWEKITSPVK
ncbi:MAG: hypothetical protein EXR70_20425 [Deltaproteobacteria bacterium]|nr:hypothetical protein [Deltaproteobacteria bacterium]